MTPIFTKSTTLKYFGNSILGTLQGAQGGDFVHNEQEHESQQANRDEVGKVDAKFTHCKTPEFL